MNKIFYFFVGMFFLRIESMENFVFSTPEVWKKINTEIINRVSFYENDICKLKKKFLIEQSQEIELSDLQIIASRYKNKMFEAKMFLVYSYNLQSLIDRKKNSVGSMLNDLNYGNDFI